MELTRENINLKQKLKKKEIKLKEAILVSRLRTYQYDAVKE